MHVITISQDHVSSKFSSSIFLPSFLKNSNSKILQASAHWTIIICPSLAFDHTFEGCFENPKNGKIKGMAMPAVITPFPLPSISLFLFTLQPTSMMDATLNPHSTPIPSLFTLSLFTQDHMSVHAFWHHVVKREIKEKRWPGLGVHKLPIVHAST